MIKNTVPGLARRPAATLATLAGGVPPPQATNGVAATPRIATNANPRTIRESNEKESEDVEIMRKPYQSSEAHPRNGEKPIVT
jgi:hypothetical protein